MKHILKAEAVKVNREDYYNERKRIYMPIPNFPFLSEAQIDEAIATLINPAAFAEEIKTLHQKSEGTRSTIVNTNFVICLINWTDYPELIKLLTIVREWAFRNDGGGVGSVDYDDFDLRPEMMQLVIIDPDYEEIKSALIGGYRYAIHNRETYSKGPMGAHFQYSENWLNETWVELGRSFINPYFRLKQQSRSFDYVIHGLGYILAKFDVKGYFGKVTLYNIYEQLEADKFFLTVMKNYVTLTNDIWVNEDERVPESELTEEQKELLDKGAFKGLFYILRNKYHIQLVPIMAVYNRMTEFSKILYFGAFRHFEFGNTTEVGIAVNSEDLYPVIREKFIQPYI